MKKPEPRNPLEKEKFLGGNRQRWTGILLLYSILIAIFQINFSIDPSPYISYALTIGSLFILGGSVDSFLQITAAKTKPPKTDEGSN